MVYAQVHATQDSPDPHMSHILVCIIWIGNNRYNFGWQNNNENDNENQFSTPPQR